MHPYLAPIALIMARWLGREGMHGGGIVAGDGVWAVSADKTGGKSTTLAWMALAGMGVMSDDILVIDAGQRARGPAVDRPPEEPARAAWRRRADGARGRA